MATQAPSELAAQYREMREGVGLLDRSVRGKLNVVGPDAAEYLHGQLTNDIEGLEHGHGCYAALLNPKGKILADMRVVKLSREELWIDTEPDSLEAVRLKLDKFKIGRQVEVVDRTHERSIFSLIGPAARGATGADPAAVEHAWTKARIAGADALAVATDIGVDLLFDHDDETQIRLALTEGGAVPVVEEHADVLRVESGRPRYGIDITDDNLPGEAGIEERAVSFTKGCYVGQEPVARMHYRGHPNRHLRGLRLSAAAQPGETVSNEDREVGRLTSACVSPALGPIGLAILRREVEPGGQVSIGGSGTTAGVVELPFEG